jgi:hypothetical protein
MSTHPRPRRWSFATVVCCFLILNLPVGDGDAQASLKDSHPASAAEALPANTSANNSEPIALLTESETDTAALQRLQSHRLSGQVASELSDARRFRSVGIHPRVLAPESVKPGDTLYLALFDDVHLWATVDHISSDINGVRSLRGRVQESEHGTVLLSIGEESILAHVVIPELEQEFVISNFGEELGHIARDINLDLKDVLEGGPPLLPPLEQLKDNEVAWSSGTGTKTSESAETMFRIDLMVIYTPAARRWADNQATSINHLINQAVAKGQLVLDNSEVGISLNLVHAAEINYTESGDSSNDLRFITQNSDEVRVLRDLHGADLVTLLARVEDVGGWAWQLGSESGSPAYGFQLVRVQQAITGYTFIHEIGHNMGAHHHVAQNDQPGPGIYSSSAGWRWAGQDGQRYCSVMTYESGSYFSDGRDHSRVPYFSSPTLAYQGEPVGDPADGDNARTLVNTKAVISAYRGCSPTTTPFNPGRAVTGILADTDCQSTLGPPGRYYDAFRFAATAGTPYTIFLRSSDFDTYLYLLNSAGQVLAQAGDGAGGYDSGIIYTPSVSETLLIHATSQVSGATGAYRLALSAADRAPAPSRLRATAVSGSRIDLIWRDNSPNEAAFRIERKIGAGRWLRIGRVGANVTRYADAGLKRSNAYAYRVRAINAAGISPPSNVARAATDEPAAPSRLTATALSNRRIKLTWRDNSPDESGFRIERKIGTGNWTRLALRDADATSHLDIGLARATTFVYRVRAINAVGVSRYTNVASATTP